MRLIYDARYDYIGQWRFPAHCWLRAYVPDTAGDLPVVVATELPDNPGTSVTDFAERLAWSVAHEERVWTLAPGAQREGFTWLEHYPREEHPGWKTMHVETFMRVTFAYSGAAEANAGNLGDVAMVETDPETEAITGVRTGTVHAAGEQGTLGEPEWEDMTRKQVEQLIGQPFPPIG